jgi:signal transduction histidine kinase
VVSTDGSPEFLAAATRAFTAAAPLANGPAAIVPVECAMPCVVAVKRVEGRPGFVVALVAETSELAAGSRAMARTILLTAALSGIVMVLVSQVVVRRVTAPLDRLVSFVRQMSPDDRKRRAEVGHNEVGALALAFNDMLERLERSQDALVRSEKLALAGLIAARVAHDIRNPLSSIKMQTQLLRDRLGGDPDDEAAVTAVLHDIEQVESVIRDLLELARPGELRLERGALNAVIHDALRQLGAQFRHRKISVDLHLTETLPPILVDHSRFKQVLLNVLVNASDAMPTGGLVTLSSRMAGSSELLVEICDDGIGMDAATLARVFDPFVSTKRDGVGLGLVNAKAVVEAHGGRISLASRTPKGTCASLWLPAAPPNPTEIRSSSTV